MRITKEIKLICNGDSPDELQCSLEYDNWHFDGTYDEVKEQLASLLDRMDYEAKKGIEYESQY